MHHTTWNLTLKRMETIIREVIAANDLTGLGLNLISANASTPFTVFVHWDGGCKHGNGKTISDAISIALQQMRDEQKAQLQRETDDFERGNAAYAASFVA